MAKNQPTDRPEPRLPRHVPVQPALPPGRPLDLGERGTTWVRQTAGPRDAPTLLLLHGWTATADLNWFTSYAELGRAYRVVALDHRGHGRGIHSRDRFRLEDCADDAAAVIEALDLGPVIPVGYSMGGPIAQLLWQRHHHLVRGMVLCSTAGSFQTRADERFWFAGVEGLARMARVAPPSVLGRLGQRVMSAGLDRGPLHDWVLAERCLSNPRILIEAGASLGHFDSLPWIEGVDVPTSVVVTTRDRVVPPARQERLAAAIPDAVVHRIEADHSVCVTDPERFVPVLLDACSHASTPHLVPA